MASQRTYSSSIPWWIILSAPILADGICPTMSLVTSGSYVEADSFSITSNMHVKDANRKSLSDMSAAFWSWGVALTLSNTTGTFGYLDGPGFMQSKSDMFDCNRAKLVQMTERWGWWWSNAQYELRDSAGAKIADIDGDTTSTATRFIMKVAGAPVVQVELFSKGWFERFITWGSSGAFEKAVFSYFATSAAVPAQLVDPRVLSLFAGYQFVPGGKSPFLTLICTFVPLICCCLCCCGFGARARGMKGFTASRDPEQGTMGFSSEGAQQSRTVFGDTQAMGGPALQSEARLGATVLPGSVQKHDYVQNVYPCGIGADGVPAIPPGSYGVVMGESTDGDKEMVAVQFHGFDHPLNLHPSQFQKLEAPPMTTENLAMASSTGMPATTVVGSPMGSKAPGIQEEREPFINKPGITDASWSGAKSGGFLSMLGSCNWCGRRTNRPPALQDEGAPAPPMPLR